MDSSTVLVASSTSTTSFSSSPSLKHKSFSYYINEGRLWNHCCLFCSLKKWMLDGCRKQLLCFKKSPDIGSSLHSLDSATKKKKKKRSEPSSMNGKDLLMILDFFYRNYETNAINFPKPPQGKYYLVNCGYTDEWLFETIQRCKSSLLAIPNEATD